MSLLEQLSEKASDDWEENQEELVKSYCERLSLEDADEKDLCNLAKIATESQHQACKEAANAILSVLSQEEEEEFNDEWKSVERDPQEDWSGRNQELINCFDSHKLDLIICVANAPRSRIEALVELSKEESEHSEHALEILKRIKTIASEHPKLIFLFCERYKELCKRCDQVCYEMVQDCEDEMLCESLEDGGMTPEESYEIYNITAYGNCARIIVSCKNPQIVALVKGNLKAQRDYAKTLFE